MPCRRRLGALVQETKAATDPSRVVFWQMTASHLLLVSKITSCPFLSTRDQIQTKNELEYAGSTIHSDGRT